jgi:hypothetical protein
MGFAESNVRWQIDDRILTVGYVNAKGRHLLAEKNSGFHALNNYGLGHITQLS